MNRPTRDVVVIILAVSLSAVLLVVTVGVIAIALSNPDADGIGAAVESVGHMLTLLVGAVVGYLAGRGRNGD